MSKHSDDDTARRSEEERARAAKEKEQHAQKQKQGGDKNPEQLRAEGERQAKENEKNSPLGETPKPGSRDPGYTVMSNPPPQHTDIPIPEPTDDPMATPSAGPLPNPVSRPGGDPTGSVNVTATGEKLNPDHPDYRKDADDYRPPDHRTAEEKKADPRE